MKLKNRAAKTKKKDSKLPQERQKIWLRGVCMPLINTVIAINVFGKQYY